MIIAIDATTIGSQSGGDETLVLSLLRGLVRTAASDDEVLVLTAPGSTLPPEVVQDSRFRFSREVRRAGFVHFSRSLPRWLHALIAQGHRPDVVVSVTHAPLRSPVPVALMVTDLSFLHVPDAYPRRTRLRLRLLVRRQVRSAAAILTISEYCRSDLIASYDLPPERVHVVPAAIEPPLACEPSTRESLAARGVRPPFLLYLGNLHPRKNVPLAIRAFAATRTAEPTLADHQFVVAGRKWFGSQAEEVEAAAAPPGSVLLLDRISSAEREVLLHDAEAVVYLSTFEGFGLPPLEAMARGTAVLASDRTAVPEICGQAALLVDPEQPEEVAAALRRLLTDSDLRTELVGRGYERVSRYNLTRTGDALLKALKSAAGRPAGALTPAGTTD